NHGGPAKRRSDIPKRTPSKRSSRQGLCEHESAEKPTDQASQMSGHVDALDLQTQDQIEADERDRAVLESLKGGFRNGAVLLQDSGEESTVDTEDCSRSPSRYDEWIDEEAGEAADQAGN